VTVNISFLILLLGISLNTQAGERLQDISGSMGKSTNLFSKLFDDEHENADTTGKRQHEEITVETKLEAERDVAQIKEGERNSSIKDNSATFFPDQEKKSADAIPEIDIISDINAQFEDNINKLQAAEVKPKAKTASKKPTQIFINDSVTTPTTDATSQANDTHHATNQTATIQATANNCVKEKVYSLDVDNAAQYERLEDFPFTYECVIQR